MNTIKIVINSDFGGFGLSDKAIREYALKKGMTLVEEKCGQFSFTNFYNGEISENNLFLDRDIDRSDIDLVKIVETLGTAANGKYANLKVVEIPKDVDGNWYIEEYDGQEHVAERHRTWS
jgi:hypothetical protein